MSKMMFRSPKHLPIGVSWQEVWAAQAEMRARIPEREEGRPGPEPYAREAAEAFLEKLLAERSEVQGAVVRRLAAAEGITARTLRRAKESLGIRSRKRLIDGVWRYVWMKGIREGDRCP